MGSGVAAFVGLIEEKGEGNGVGRQALSRVEVYVENGWQTRVLVYAHK